MGFPGQRLGMAFKVEDGSFRPKSAIAVEALRQTGLLPAAAIDAYARNHVGPDRNVRGDAIGELRTVFQMERV
jgi:L-asparaginase II